MGCGKSTVGKVLAKKIDRPFFDSDIEIVRVTGVEISTIFEIEGENAFRDRESSVLQELLHSESILLATGGGAVIRPANRNLMRQRGVVIYMHASPTTVYQRIRTHRGRPILASGNPLQRLESLYVERDAWYRETAHAIVHITNETPTVVASKIEDLVKDF